MRLAATLGDLGEQKIIELILRPRYTTAEFRFGDDCASVRVPNGAAWLVTTTDPCPEPVAALIGYLDPYFRGWLLATINLSDLAAAGAEPLGLLTSLVLPADTAVDSFSRLLDGIDDCCATAGTRVIGGNIKEGQKWELTATAIGTCDTSPLSRSGAEPGDAVLVIGDMGSFWAGYFAKTRGLVLPSEHDDFVMANVLRPQPKVAVGLAMRRANLVSACIDNSDGLYTSLSSLARANGMGVRVDLSSISVPPPVAAVAELLDVSPERFALGWGDWQLICTTRSSNVEAVRATCNEIGVPVTTIGEMVSGDSVQVTHLGRAGQLITLDSQRFTPDSWFTTGLDAYADRLLTGTIVNSPKTPKE
ncbi:thiamine-phosphate kinase [Phytohabitans aurantiacus]|uniref:Thiamine-monophosphate kinase n=1 Tax=Phytohabitans aurantiacus TaxID=3016789 RepID=A0ABQ5QNW5_9ACTN|nr:thiamine-phosphate kinase [Phytohabitans aurantiacus]GLH95596.1 thiamine-monophosphate kinase [Phytohabitans aurantiacus]